jgi:hypothetical protein
MTESLVPEKDPKTGRFLAGNSGNGGRPKGARSKLGEQFCQDVYEKWQQAGARCIDEMIADKPGDFVKLVATMLPKEMNLTVSDGSDLSDEELHDRIRNLASQLAPFIGNGTGAPDAGIEGEAGASKSAGLH